MLRVWPPFRFQLKCFKGEVFSRWQTHSMTGSRDHLRSPQKLNNLLYCIWFGRKTTFGSEMLFASKEQWTYHYVVRYHQLKSRGQVRSNEVKSPIWNRVKNGEKGSKLTLWILHILQMLCFRFLPTLGWETKHWEGQKWGWIEIEWSAWKRSNIFTALSVFKNIIEMSILVKK